jgi:hypothetical protein
MYSKNELENVIRNKVDNNKIYDAINILDDEIKEEFIRKLRQSKNDIQYIDIIQLKNAIDKYLPKTYQVIFKKFFLISNIDTNNLYRLERLIEIYNILKNKEENNEF